jgi:nicotinate phosphoribosyltransferase
MSVPATTALLTDHYELTMLESALRDGTAQRRCVFETFARRLPDGRRYGVVAGTARLLEAIQAIRVDAETIDILASAGVVGEPTLEYLRTYRFNGDVDG